MNLNFIKYQKNISVRLNKKFDNFKEKDFNLILDKHTNSFSKSEDKFLKGINPNFKKEMIFSMEKYSDDLIELGLTTGLMAKALQNDYKNKYEKPIVLQGLLISRDNKILFGLRNKPKFRKNLPDEKNDYKIMLCPAGYATFNKEISLIKSFYKELEEELGLYEKDIGKIVIFGHNKDIGFTEGIRITYVVFTKLEFSEIKKRWEKADHSWEYLELIGIDAKEEDIRALFEAEDLSVYHKSAKGIIVSSITPVLDFLISNNNHEFEILRKI
jgi:hypothetical protein